MADQRPRCPACQGLLKHEPASVVGPERVYCICGWSLYRPDSAPVTAKREEATQKHELNWVAQALSAKATIKKRGTVMSTGTTNTLSTLNDHLFGQLERLSSKEISGEKLREEIERTRAMSGLAKEMIDNAKLALEVQRTLGGKPSTPAMLQLESK